MRIPLAALLALCLLLPWTATAQADYLAAAGTATAVSATCNPGTTHTFVLVGEEVTAAPGGWTFVVVEDGGAESLLETGGSLCELGLQGPFQGPWSPVAGGCLPGAVPVVLCLEAPVLLAPHVAQYGFHYAYSDGRPTWDGTATLAYA
jgi:hypothetical protein